MSSKEVVSVVADPHLLAEVEQCVAVLGSSLIDGLMDASLASRWRSADAVVADCGGLDEVSSLSLPPRRGVFVVCADTPPWERGVHVGAEDVMVLPARSGDLVEALSTRCSGGSVSGGCVAVVSAVGGAGGSTVSAGLALSWARSGHGVVVVDADCVAGADDVLLGVASEPGMRWGDVSACGWEDGGVDGRAVAANIPATPEGVGVLSVGRGTPAAVEWNQRGALVQRVAGALAREGLLVVVDVSGATWWEASDFTGCDCVFVVVPATLRGLGGALRWSRVARQAGADPVAVVKHGVVSSVGAKDVESVTSMPVVAEFTAEKKVAKEIEETGLRLCGRSSFARMVSGLCEVADGYMKNGMSSLLVDRCAINSAQSCTTRKGELAA
ncbi:septum site-determining protein Ssd [uncultured Corynebacterium sp.]|uniref:septum site-determining protein Ssd n=1 Tax=uncultured Corynebacterium sp. TaxID=159447 RepID=UPI0025E2F398|nr:septum site-determining protein Ssd [uncultured Corynebacterium sp.]